ncbi:hypothetical protein PV772_08935 [Pseudarthrobacter sp. CC12]|uniref:YobI family P-loop NTPase n=1 Tax=Pseudarthrobacter sp. CC12 TaxID=3029193 RepID=UPI00326477DE
MLAVALSALKSLGECFKEIWRRAPQPEVADAATKLLSLTPRYEADKHEVYFKALDAALQDNAVLNVALTGSYGVGKSSILEELARRHAREVIRISLSTLGLPEETIAPANEAATSTTKTNRIQKEIFKQLLFSQEPGRMPGSRYRRITSFRLLREIRLAALVAVPVTLAFYLTGWTESLSKLVILPSEWHLLVHAILFVSAALVILGFRFVFHNRIQIDKISAGSATISLSTTSGTYFDEYLDEIVYFFEVVNRNIVIFEDIDRFDDAHIFETLRSLNSILNGARQLKGRRIRFVYAIKDSIFDELGTRAAKEELDDDGKQPKSAGSEDAAETRKKRELATPLPSSDRAQDSAEAQVARANRTKFFDLVIPVVPFITHRSARDLLVETMKDIKPGVSTDLIDLTARHVADMRLIKNIRNEFVVFKQLVIDTGTLELDADKLFAMMLYKSTHLTDFEQIKLGKSNLDKLYRDGRELVDANVKARNTQIARARSERAKARISAERSENLAGALVEYVKLTLWGQGQSIRSYGLDGDLFTEASLRKPEFWEALSASDALRVTYANFNGYERTLDLTRAQIEEAVEEPLNSRQWAEAERARLDGETQQALGDRGFLVHADMSDLMSRAEFVLKRGEESLSFQQLAEKHLTSELATQLVAAGYIDKNFTLYTSTFYGERISANATNFILKVIDPNVPDMFFTLTAEDVDAIIREKGKGLLRERASFNINILDRILVNNAEAVGILAGRLMTDGGEGREFLLAYLEDGRDPAALVGILTEKWPNIFTVLIEDEELDQEKALHLVNVALLSLNNDVDYIVTDAARDYIIDNYADFAAFTAGDTTQEAADRVAELVRKAGVRLPLLRPLSAEILPAIVANRSYHLTRENLQTALGEAGHSLNLDAIAKANGAVYGRLLEDLSGYLTALHDQEPTVVNPDKFIATLQDVSEADEDQLPAIISRAVPGCRVDELDSVPKAAWRSLAEGQRFPAIFTNIAAYISALGLDRSIAQLLGDAGKIDVGDDADEPAKLELALTILRAMSEIPSAQFRAELVHGLSLESPIAASEIPAESGELVGHLIAQDVVADDATTFSIIKQTDVAGLAFAISKSRAFVEFMTVAEVAPRCVGALIDSPVVPARVKDAIVDRFGEFTSEASATALASVASYALDRHMAIDMQDVVRLADEGVREDIVVPHLEPHLPSLDLPSLTTVLDALGGKYADLTAANGKHPRIANTAANQALADRLYSLGVVSSVDHLGVDLKVNMRQKPQDLL